MTITFPEHVGEVLFSIFTAMGDSIARLILAPDPGPKEFQLMEELVTTYSDAIERILGAPKGSLLLAEPESLRIWFPRPGVNSQPAGESLSEGMQIS